MRGKKITGFASREQVLKNLFDAWEVCRTEELVPLNEACGRVTSRELVSENTLPVYRVSACDGIAVRSEDFKNGMPDYKSWVEGMEFARADTGDDFDDAFDVVIMIEETDIDKAGRITFISEDIRVVSGANVTQAGSTVKAGDKLVGAGVAIRPSDLAAIAMGGHTMVPVIKKPVVAFIPTGSELVPPSVKPRRGQNVDTNSLLVGETVRELGAQPLIFPIVPDDKALLKKTLQMALAQADIVIINGGTAKGSEDFNTALIEKRGKLLDHYVAAAPGRPMALGIIGGKPVINLPGPAIAAFFGCRWCLSAVVCRALGVPAPENEILECTLTEDFSAGKGMAVLCCMQVTKAGNEYHARRVPFKGGSIPACLAANAMYVSPAEQGGLTAGEKIPVTLLRGREYVPQE